MFVAKDAVFSLKYFFLLKKFIPEAWKRERRRKLIIIPPPRNKSN